jgi:hypothetical protein
MPCLPRKPKRLASERQCLRSSAKSFGRRSSGILPKILVGTSTAKIWLTHKESPNSEPSSQPLNSLIWQRRNGQSMNRAGGLLP